MNREKVIFILPALTGGGAERAAIDILNHLSVDRFEKVLALFSSEGVYHKNIAKEIRVIRLETRGRWDRLVAMRRLVRSERPNVVVSFLSHMAPTVVRVLEGSFSLVIDEQNPPKAFLQDLNFFGTSPIKAWLASILIKLYYRMADRIVVISNGIGRELVEHYNVSQEKIIHIPNPIDLNIVRRSMKDNGNPTDASKGGIKIIAVGRLAQQKDYPTLFRAFSIIKKNVGMPLQLNVLGDGPEKANLLGLVRELGIENEVLFLGFKENPWRYIRESDIFVLSSLYEGFGNVIIEAMACGTPVVSTACNYGPNEIITDHVNGLLVPPGDSNFLAETIIELLGDKDLRNRLSASGYRRVLDYNVISIAKRYEEVLTIGLS